MLNINAIRDLHGYVAGLDAETVKEEMDDRNLDGEPVDFDYAVDFFSEGIWDILADDHELVNIDDLSAVTGAVAVALFPLFFEPTA